MKLLKENYYEVDNTEVQFNNGMYKDYASELDGTITVEKDYGFIQYKRINPTSVYITAVYVKPEHRAQNLGATLVNDLEIELSSQFVTTFITSIDLTSSNPIVPLIACLGMGYTYATTENSTIFMKKERK